jgi:DNA-binding LacI/PurR family transcriptional regulator
MYREPAPHRTTLDDVARAAGVSRSTASRVLAGYGPASPAARDRVSTAAARLGYAPDRAARSLVTGAGVRLVVAVIGPSSAVLDDPYVGRVVSSVAAIGAPHSVGVSLEWLHLHAGQRIRRLGEDRSVIGVVLLNSTEQIQEAVPSVLSGRIVSIGVGSRIVPSFDVDNGGATTAAARHLCAAGRRRVALVSGPTWMACSRRPIDAYRSAMREAGLPERVVPSDFTAAGGRAAMLEVLRRWPDTDAVFATSDVMALGAIAVLRERGIDVPGDIAVAGFDDIPYAALSVPTLTTASHPVDRIAAGAATAVLTEARVPPITTYPSELILRQSA